MALRYCCDWCDKQLPVTITGEGTENKKITAELYFPRKVNIRDTAASRTFILTFTF